MIPSMKNEKILIVWSLELHYCCPLRYEEISSDQKRSNPFLQWSSPLNADIKNWVRHLLERKVVSAKDEEIYLWKTTDKLPFEAGDLVRTFKISSTRTTTVFLTDCNNRTLVLGD